MSNHLFFSIFYKVFKSEEWIYSRYHFAALEGVFYERFPYRNHVVLQEKSLHVSRFISLAPFGNKIKHKVFF